MLTTKQKRFADEYMVDFNATQAAIRAGYSKDTASEIGYENLRKPQIKSHIDEKLAEIAMGPDQAKKLISDIAKGSLNDYFTLKKIEHTPRVLRSLTHLINDLRRKIAFEEEVAGLAKMTKEDKKMHVAAQKEREMQILRYQVELKHNPKATRIVDGETVLIDAVELDMVKLVADKERGRIKSIAHTQHGPRVEMYSADSALFNIAKIHGLYKDDDKEKSVNISINGKEVKVS